ncbi:MAG: hypothetical protein AB1333_02860 [Patescibacteria group bacterium]
MDTKIKNIIVVLVLVVIVVVLFFVFGKNKDTQDNQAIQKQKLIQENTLGGTIYDAIPKNPAEKIPETNPFKVEVNPYKGAYINPFENK